MPNNQSEEIPPNWTQARVEEHSANTIKLYYIYLCPRHTIATADRQANLF